MELDLSRHSLTYPSNVTEIYGVSKSGNQLNLLFKSKRRGSSKLGYAISEDNLKFTEQDAPILINPKVRRPADLNNISGAQFNRVLNRQIITFSLNNRLSLATTVKDADLDIDIWHILTKNIPAAEAGTIVSEFKHNNQYVMYHSKGDIKVSFSKDLYSWHGSNNSVINSRKYGFDSGKIKVLDSQIVEQGIVVTYQSSFKRKKKTVLRLGAALFDKAHPERLLWQSQSEILELILKPNDEIKVVGTVFSDYTCKVYLTSQKDRLFCFAFTSPLDKPSRAAKSKLKLTKHRANPIIAPEGGQDWEQAGTFNPAAIFHNDSFHMFYRAMSQDGISRFGYATSKDGLDFTRFAKAAYDHSIITNPPKGLPRRHDTGLYLSGGGWGGCEDPRAVVIDGYLYLSFCVFENWYSMRQAVTKLSLRDLEKQNWNWSKPQLISPKNQRQKNWMLFPEKVNGKFAVIHALSPKIKVDYFDSLDQLEKNPIVSPIQGDNDRFNGLGWDGFLRGASAPPVKTESGWLLFYHGTDPKDPGSGYRLGAMLLALDDPSQIIARTSSPILEPEEWYEHNHKPNVIYASAAVVKNGQLYVYYGGGDRHVCVATTSLNKFLDDLLKHKQVYLQSS